MGRNIKRKMKHSSGEISVSFEKFYEAWHWRAHIAHLMEEWSDAREFASKIETLHKGNHHLVKPEVWEWWGFDLFALSSHKLQIDNDAIKYGTLAYQNNQQNYTFQKKISIIDVPFNNSNLKYIKLNPKLKLLP